MRQKKEKTCPAQKKSRKKGLIFFFLRVIIQNSALQIMAQRMVMNVKPAHAACRDAVRIFAQQSTIRRSKNK